MMLDFVGNVVAVTLIDSSCCVCIAVRIPLECIGVCVSVRMCACALERDRAGCVCLNGYLSDKVLLLPE